MKDGKPLIIAAALLGAAAAFGGLQAQEHSDDRELVQVSQKWHDHLLTDMREGLFVQVQEILAAVGEGDMARAAELATERGKAHFAKMDPAMMKELPPGMKMMGKAMHLAFDDVATAARETGDPAKVAGALSDLMSACTACHMTYKLNP